MRSTSESHTFRLACLSTAEQLRRDEDNFLYVSYSGENTFGQEGWIELP